MTRVPGHVIHVHPPGEAGVVVDLLQHVGRELEPRVAGAVRVGDVVLLLQHRTCHDCHNTCHVSRVTHSVPYARVPVLQPHALDAEAAVAASGVAHVPVCRCRCVYSR